MMEKHKVPYDTALQMLEALRLNLVCGIEIKNSPSLQAALLTAVNTGKRAFHGGVTVQMPDDVPLLLPWPNARTLNEVVAGLGGLVGEAVHSSLSQTLYIGKFNEVADDSLTIVSSGWRGGIVPKGVKSPELSGPDFSLGGVLAGAFGVGRGFLRVSGLSSRDTEEPEGFSLWRPDLHWRNSDADGPILESLPKNIWSLGLGHLGQAFLWNIALLPYENPSDLKILLQDFDFAVAGNFTAQLLCEAECVGRKKARFCAEFLEERGFDTTICERPFDEFTRRQGDEPFVALCGFDEAEPRRYLENAGFDLVVGCALGGDTRTFDKILLHTFPNASRKASEIWAESDEPKGSNEVRDALATDDEDCGILAETLSKKAVSTSFVGAVAGAFGVAEVLRALHGGKRFEFLHMQLRVQEPPRTIKSDCNYQKMVARSGFTLPEQTLPLAA